MPSIVADIPNRAGLFVFPVMLIYTLCSYSVFKGKVDDSAGHY
jgi:cytochrome bd ubiquinol oxidase subunit II